MEPLDELYFKWLYRQVASVRMRNPARTYWSLFRLLYSKEFVWFIPNDDNRAEDGRDLRWEFSSQNDISPESDWLRMGCSVLEMMVGLARRLAFESDLFDESRDWFWHMLENLDLRDYSDARYRESDAGVIDDILDALIWRTYDYDGRGGLFPLREPTEDQRKVEIWYQQSYYVIEQEM